MVEIDFSENEFGKIPFDRIERVGQRSLLNSDLFCVSWLLGRYCNYRCSYCWPYGRSDTKDHRPFEVLKKTMDQIKSQANARGFNSFHFSFSGGEPTQHPEYLNLLQYYASDTAERNYQSVHMTTNLSQSKTWFKEYAEATKNLHRVSITASYHKEFAKKEMFRDKIWQLQEDDIQVTINMVLVPTRFELLWEDALFFHEQGINVTLKPQSDERAAKIVDGYTEEHLKLLREGLPQRDYTGQRLRDKNKVSTRPPNTFKSKKNLSASAAGENVSNKATAVLQLELTDETGLPHYMDQAERLNSFGFNNFKTWECSAGYRSIIIREPGGVVKRSYSCADAPLGTLEDGFSLLSDPAPCLSSSCVSSADSKIPKRRSGTQWSLWNQKDS